MILHIVWWIAERTLSPRDYERRVRAYNVGFGFRFLGRNWGEP